jgi:hypothetical protein
MAAAVISVKYKAVTSDEYNRHGIHTNAFVEFDALTHASERVSPTPYRRKS